MKASPEHEREAERQQALMRVLWRDTEPATLQAWLRDAPARQQRGLQAYRINAAVSAERALASAYPTVAALIGAESFAALARDLWRQRPPERGDLGEWGGALPAFIADSPSLAGEAYLADSAGLDWWVHLASRAADAAEAPAGLDALATHEPDALRIELRPGTAVLASAWPIASIWLAHQDHTADDADRFAGVRAAFDAGLGENTLVWRNGYAVRVETLDAGSAAFAGALLQNTSLAAALDAAGDHFAFDHWLVHALQQRLIVAVHTREIST
jgi:hypothetical protein